MEMDLAPISASLGAMASLAEKLDALMDTELKDEIGKLKTRLLKLSKAWDPPLTARRWMKDVRGLSYEMENCVDTETDWIDRISRFKVRAKDSNGRYDRYDLEDVLSHTDHIDPIVGHRLPTVHGDREQDPVVGLHVHDGPFHRLCHLLTNGDEQLKVLSIVGVGGIGKTTLAKQLWRKHKPRDYFHCRAFVRTAKRPDMRRILRSILAQVRPHQPPVANEVQELIHDLREHLQDKRYFVIIDDLWATSVWDVARRAFPEGIASRILTTTEIEDVALACCSYKSKYILKMEPLSDSHSRELFTRAIFGSGDEKYRQIYEVPDEIIRICEGLPQAIISISSVLAIQGKAKTAENWEQIQNSLPTNTTSEEKLKQVLNFCYRCLPSYLQTCLLYFSLYPENYVLLKEDIMKQWLAEGFICGPTAKDKMEVAGSYFDRLVNMGLIQHIDVDYGNEVSYYAVHHMVHDIITSKSIEDNFITVLDYSKRTTGLSNKVSRLSLHFDSATYATTPASTGLSQVRSLAFIGLLSCFPSNLEFKLLRLLTLHIWCDQASTLFNLGAICELFLLRYMQITCNITVRLPDQMQGLKYLETFEINARISAIPSDIFHLQSLLHLRLGGGTELPDVTGIVKNVTLNTPPSASGRAISLDDSSSPPYLAQTIELLPPISRMPKWIEQLSNLCILKIMVRELQRNDISNLQGLPALTVLSLYVQCRTSTEPICFVVGAFAALEYFEFRCGLLCLSFEEGTMPSLQRIKLGFNAHRREQYGVSLVGIEGMLSVQKITIVIGSAAGAEERDMKAAESAVKEALGKDHSNVCVKRGDIVEEEFDPPEKHHSILEKHTSTSSDQPGSGKQESQENIKQNADTNCRLTQRQSNKKEHGSVEPRNNSWSSKMQKNNMMDHGFVVPGSVPFHLLEEMTDGFSESRKIGSGSYGNVYMGVNKDGKKIAIKILDDMVGLHDDQFERECLNLACLQHQNIVQLVGYCHETRRELVMYGGKFVHAHGTKRALCLEYMYNGSLENFLSEESKGHDWCTRYTIIKGVCNGLKYLHQELESPMYHLDLKLANVLLNENMVPKIADFGLSRFFGEQQTQRTKSIIGTRGYLPPEYIEGEIISIKFDIFSLGVVIIKILKGPKGHFRSAEMSSSEFIKTVHKNWRNRLQARSEYEWETYSEQVKSCIEIALSCLETDRSKRPSIGDIVHKLNETETKLQFGSGLINNQKLSFSSINQGGSLEKHIADGPCELDWPMCYNIIIGICEGLNHLHNTQEKPIFHLDLKPANILLDKSMMPKIADLELSRVFSSLEIHETENIKGTIGYMPPEFIDRGAISNKNDVFSLGVIIIQMLDGRKGYFRCSDVSSEQFIELVSQKWAKRLQAMPGPNSSHKIDILRVRRCAEIALRCIDKDRKKRPSIQDIVRELDQELDAEINNMPFSSNLSNDLTVQSPSLQRPTDAGCKMLSSRLLKIANNQPQYWRWISLPDSRFPECAELLSVYFFAVIGEVPPEDLSPDTSYAVYLVYKLTSSTSGLRGCVQTASLRLYGERIVPGSTCKVSLDPEAHESASDVTYPVARGDGWLELRLAEFQNDEAMRREQGVIVDLREEDVSVQKRGLIVEGMEFRSN